MWREVPGVSKQHRVNITTSFLLDQPRWNQLDVTFSFCRRRCLASVSSVTTPSDCGDRRLFTPAFQVGRLRCARCRGSLDAKSHFTPVLMSPGEWRGVRTGRWCLQMRTPKTASRPDTRCWCDYGVACRGASECMGQVRRRIQGWLSETDMCVACIYLYFHWGGGGVVYVALHFGFCLLQLELALCFRCNTAFRLF